MKVTPQELAIRLAWPLELKRKWAVNRIAEFVIEMDGEVYNTFSGGKDSRTVKDLIDGIWDGRFKDDLPIHIWRKVVSYAKPCDSFCNTGLEFPEIVEYVKTFDNVTELKPKMGFTRVIKEIGVAVGSKKIAMMIRRLKGYISNPSPTNAATKNLYLHGIKSDGSISKGSMLPKMWRKLLDAPFKVSDKCCDIFKKQPFKLFEVKTGLKPIIGTTVNESAQRKVSYYITGCNSFEEGHEKCRPISIWTEKDIWEYSELYGIRHCEIYYDRWRWVEQLDGTKVWTFLTGEKSTGCTFCLFGLHLDDKTKNNRIQRLAVTHPKYWHIVVIKCGLGEVLKFCGIPFMPMAEVGKQTELL
ncbi:MULTISPECIES: phosphoadenosine phosphosulfate reductase family protein [unclassified Pedobacter]|uniref:phosphoadenosine phosphosulfate reductase domain-containing protein n=1 Tax=unclassified Pedobacter TaxID=2628915 RepID=UPI00141E22A3|nr:MULTISPECIES: phosphoadenosine phosphosulfate reductase family protein [unclassified Pedobacter]NII81695.1 3'-phosphoadenosine 5'-phosphosulfate sulfotransferase (PAPS reductase)/FAD synthetase [Pedobacter sp. SG908]NMN35699.1 3'-phosphoadenosine 5'-phosphosulfate sulfotransferase (PAPS reductase)/FAD synthetase [Pedobacter sp. SG918]